MNSLLPDGAAPPAGVAIPGRQEAPVVGARTGRQQALEVAQFHKHGLEARRYRDLTAEKYMIHIDAEGDAQWSDILNGATVAIPPELSGGPRSQDNLLRPLVANMVAYHTTMQIRFAVARSLGRDRERSVVDQALVNHVSRTQRWNGKFAEAMYMAAPYGHGLVHAWWRDALDGTYDPVSAGLGGVPGGVDCWVGDPWDTVYHTAATRSNVQAYSYGRTVSLDLVKKAFAHLPYIDQLHGSDRIPSASAFQRIARRWLYGTGRDVHGSAVVYGGGLGGQELVALVCREVLPGVLPSWPRGRLEIIALNGSATTFAGGPHGGYGDPMLLHVGPLPAGVPSAVRVYADGRYDDVLGKPFVADLDDLQMLLNQLETYANEYIRRSVRAPLAIPEGTDLDTLAYDDNVLLEVDATAQKMPEFMSLPRTPIEVLRWRIEDVKEAMFRIGGWQAASRGESRAGDSGKKVIALARADDSIHGPTNQRFREAVEDFAGIVWRLYKEYGDVPTMIDVVGGESSYLADRWVSNDRMSDRSPMFSLVSGFGATTEAKGQQLMELVTTRAADGKPLMTSDEFRAAWPDDSVYPQGESSTETRARRAHAINAGICQMAHAIAKQNPTVGQMPLGDPRLTAIAQQLLQQQVDVRFPILMDDDVQVHVETLSLITQDEDELPLARAIAVGRQRMYFAWANRQRQQAEEEAQHRALEMERDKAIHQAVAATERKSAELGIMQAAAASGKLPPGLQPGGTGGMASVMERAGEDSGRKKASA